MFKVGDKVKVIYAQKIPQMQIFVGCICTISTAEKGVYTLKEDKYKFGWLSKWLEPYEPETQIEIQEDNILELLGEEYA